jgi:hypothetical protein
MIRHSESPTYGPIDQLLIKSLTYNLKNNRTPSLKENSSSTAGKEKIWSEWKFTVPGTDMFHMGGSDTFNKRQVGRFPHLNMRSDPLSGSADLSCLTLFLF